MRSQYVDELNQYENSDNHFCTCCENDDHNEKLIDRQQNIYLPVKETKESQITERKSYPEPVRVKSPNQKHYKPQNIQRQVKTSYIQNQQQPLDTQVSMTSPIFNPLAFKPKNLKQIFVKKETIQNTNQQQKVIYQMFKRKEDQIGQSYSPENLRKQTSQNIIEEPRGSVNLTKINVKQKYPSYQIKLSDNDIKQKNNFGPLPCIPMNVTSYCQPLVNTRYINTIDTYQKQKENVRKQFQEYDPNYGRLSIGKYQEQPRSKSKYYYKEQEKPSMKFSFTATNVQNSKKPSYNKMVNNLQKSNLGNENQFNQRDSKRQIQNKKFKIVDYNLPHSNQGQGLNINVQTNYKTNFNIQTQNKNIIKQIKPPIYIGDQNQQSKQYQNQYNQYTTIQIENKPSYQSDQMQTKYKGDDGIQKRESSQSRKPTYQENKNRQPTYSGILKQPLYRTSDGIQMRVTSQSRPSTYQGDQNKQLTYPDIKKLSTFKGYDGIQKRVTSQQQPSTYHGDQNKHLTQSGIQKETSYKNSNGIQRRVTNQSRQQTYQENQNRQPTYQENQNRQPTYQENQNRQPTYQENQNRQPTYQENQNRQPTYQENQNRQPTYQENQNRQPIYPGIQKEPSYKTRDEIQKRDSSQSIQPTYKGDLNKQLIYPGIKKQSTFKGYDGIQKRVTSQSRKATYQKDQKIQPTYTGIKKNQIFQGIDGIQRIAQSQQRQPTYIGDQSRQPTYPGDIFRNQSLGNYISQPHINENNALLSQTLQNSNNFNQSIFKNLDQRQKQQVPLNKKITLDKKIKQPLQIKDGKIIRYQHSQKKIKDQDVNQKIIPTSSTWQPGYKGQNKGGLIYNNLVQSSSFIRDKGIHQIKGQPVIQKQQQYLQIKNNYNSSNQKLMSQIVYPYIPQSTYKLNQGIYKSQPYPLGNLNNSLQQQKEFKKKKQYSSLHNKNQPSFSQDDLIKLQYQEKNQEERYSAQKYMDNPRQFLKSQKLNESDYTKEREANTSFGPREFQNSQVSPKFNELEAIRQEEMQNLQFDEKKKGQKISRVSQKEQSFNKQKKQQDQLYMSNQNGYAKKEKIKNQTLNNQLYLKDDRTFNVNQFKNIDLKKTRETKNIKEDNVKQKNIEKYNRLSNNIYLTKNMRVKDMRTHKNIGQCIMPLSLPIPIPCTIPFQQPPILYLQPHPCNLLARQHYNEMLYEMNHLFE